MVNVLTLMKSKKFFRAKDDESIFFFFYNRISSQVKHGPSLLTTQQLNSKAVSMYRAGVIDTTTNIFNKREKFWERKQFQCSVL